MNQNSEQADKKSNNSSDDSASTDEFKQLTTELHIARLSEQTQESRLRYYRLFEHVEKREGLSLTGVWETIQAVLSWDSRNQTAQQGARGLGDGNFRLLYATPQTEVELMIETQTQHNYIDGDIVPFSQSVDQSDAQTPALVTLLRTASKDEKRSANSIQAAENGWAYETESDTHGRFRFENVENGIYTMQIMLLNGSLVEIDQIELL